MLVIIFYFLEFLPFVITVLHLFIVHGFRVPVKVLFDILIRVADVFLLSVVIPVIVEPVAVKSFKENSFQNIPHKKKNNCSKD
jgi:hypothetical protein